MNTHARGCPEACVDVRGSLLTPLITTASDLARYEGDHPLSKLLVRETEPSPSLVWSYDKFIVNELADITNLI